ncbi:MAG: alpha/beta fold hydrolase [Actinomycetota bacterium]|nr:alpha/beta hydrolase [Actinomycetota bacterium]
MTISYADRGSGDAVVLLHGQPGTAADWALVAERLSPEVRAIIPDRPGYGKTGGNPAGIAENAHAVISLLDALDIETATIAGHSWAGGVALAVALRHPERVRSIILAASIGPGALHRVDKLLGVRRLGEIAAYGAMKGMGRALAFERGKRFFSHRMGEEGPGLLAEALRGKAWRSFVHEQRAMLEELPEIGSKLESIHTPALVVIGDRDKIVSASVGTALAERLPISELVVVPDAGHGLPFEAPAAMALIVERGIKAPGLAV